MNVDSAEQYARLVVELRRLGQRLDGIGDELEQLQAGAAGGDPSREPQTGSVPNPVGRASAAGVAEPVSAPSGAPHPGSPYPGSQGPGRSYPGSPHPGATSSGASSPESPYPGTPSPWFPYPGSAHPGSPSTGSQYADHPYAGGPYPDGPYPGGPYSGAQQPGVSFPGGHLPGGQDAAGPGPGGPVPGGPVPGGPPIGWAPPPLGGFRPPPSAGPRGPSRQPLFSPLSQLSGARLLAWAGGAVTLVGVVLLLVLAASRGWFAPPVRVGGGAVLGLVLVGLGARLHRKESARTGALALVATGFATLYLVVVAANAIYDYLDTIPALLLALLVAGGGLGLADRWRSQLLGGGVVVGAAVLAPFVSIDWRLVALVLALQLAALPVLLRRRWPVLMLLAAGGPVLYGAAIGLADGDTAAPTTIAVVLGVLAVGLGTASLATGSLPSKPVATLVAVAGLPAIAAGSTLGGWIGAATAAGAAVALGLLALRPGADRLISPVAAAAAAVALFAATTIAFDGTALTSVVLGQAIVAAVLGAVFRARLPLIVGMLYATYGVPRALGRDAPLVGLIRFPESPYQGPDMIDALLTGAVVSALVLGLAVAVLVATGRVGWVRPDAQSARLWVLIGLVGLYGATSLTVTLALLVSPDRTGFTAGHALVSVSWTVMALALLARGISRSALRITGLVLVAAAVAKLVLFDLVALDGIARVAAFLGAGLILLAAGTRYARMVAEATALPTAAIPHTAAPHTAAPHTAAPHTAAPHTAAPHTAAPHTAAPHTAPAPHTAAPHLATSDPAAGPARNAVPTAAQNPATPFPAGPPAPSDHRRPGPPDAHSWGPLDERR